MCVDSKRNIVNNKNKTNMKEYIEQIPMWDFSQLKDLVYEIPSQQRGYKWTPSNVKELISDLWEFINAPSNKRVYCLQPLAVVPITEKKKYSVLDGQQRLTTLFLLYKYLTGHNPYTMEFVRDFNDDTTVVNRWKFLSNVSDEKSEKLADGQIDLFYIHRAYQTISECFESLPNDVFTTYGELKTENLKNQFVELLDGKGSKSVQVIWYEVPEKKSYETFRNLNSGKISLTNTELIKALLLNRVSGLPKKELDEAAAVFELIEQQIQNDRFWYMFNATEPRTGQTRMDFLFNLVAECTLRDYETDSRWSFRNIFSKPEKGSLSSKWKQVRHTFLRLKDMYEDIYCYHYIGFLTYSDTINSNANSLNRTRELLELSREVSHSEFVSRLKKKIKSILTKNHTSVKEYTYYSDSKDLRLLFVMHNVETLLQRYTTLHDDELLKLETGFERFPFELLHRQKWDIEHIASNTDSDFKNSADRDSWLKSIKADLKDKYPSEEEVRKMENTYMETKKKEDFDKLYKIIMTKCDEYIDDAITDNDKDGKDKMQVGNLTLLDSHTNRSYHNALFPRKRRYIIVANGLEDNTNDFDKGITKVYIPPCTLSVFTKAYNKGNNLSLNAWTQKDADAYTMDIEHKLNFYYKK